MIGILKERNEVKLNEIILKFTEIILKFTEMISNSIEISGIGLHSGLEINLKIIKC